MVTVDSSGWIEYFLNGTVSERYAKILHGNEEILSPTIILYEVYKIVKREAGHHWALSAAEQIGKTRLVSLSEELACQAADYSLKHDLAMADAIVYATAQAFEAKLVTSDADFKKLPGVLYFPLEEKP